jgi:hypothetical protein
MQHAVIMLGLAVAVGCATTGDVSKLPEQPETSVRALCEKGEYHEAMRALPRAMEDWAEYTAKTGRTAEGAAGFEYMTTMMAVVEKGDADWGKILDDPDIPYNYKTEMIFEIAEARLGKGASWSPYHTEVVIVPRSKRASSWEEVNALLRNVLSEQDAAADADRQGR